MNDYYSFVLVFWVFFLPRIILILVYIPLEGDGEKVSWKKAHALIASIL